MCDIPQKVVDKARGLVDKYGCNFRFLGKRNDITYYVFEFPKDERTGFPHIFQYDNHTENVKEIGGIQALRLMKRLAVVV